MASLLPFFLLFPCFVKNETVRGTIGNTQGVSNANNPPRKPSRNIFINPASSLLDWFVPSHATRGFFYIEFSILRDGPTALPPSKLISIEIDSPGKNSSPLP